MTLFRDNTIIKLQLLFTAEKKEMTGLAIGISSMKAGERALLHVGWELGYGKEGSFSFPNVPPMADIVYEVELIGFDETKEVSALPRIAKTQIYLIYLWIH